MPINDVLTETEPLVDLDSHGQEIHLQIARFLKITLIRIVKSLHNSFETSTSIRMVKSLHNSFETLPR